MNKIKVDTLKCRKNHVANTVVHLS